MEIRKDTNAPGTARLWNKLIIQLGRAFNLAARINIGRWRLLLPMLHSLVCTSTCLPKPTATYKVYRGKTWIDTDTTCLVLLLDNIRSGCVRCCRLIGKQSLLLLLLVLLLEQQKNLEAADDKETTNKLNTAKGLNLRSHPKQGYWSQDEADGRHFIRSYVCRDSIWASTCICFSTACFFLRIFWPFEKIWSELNVYLTEFD